MFGDIGQLRLIHFCMHGQRNHSFSKPVCYRQVSSLRTEMGKHLLAVCRYRVIDHRRNALGGKIFV